MLDTLHLRTFVAVVDEGGFSHAAARLHLTQSAVSGHLRRLEEQLDRQLLRRTTRSLQITPDGQRLLGYARAILALNQDAVAELTRAPCPVRMRIGIAEDFVHEPLLRVLRDFGAGCPGLQLEVQMGIPGSLLTAMDQGALEMVLGAQCESRRDGRLLWSEPLVWAWTSRPGTEVPRPLPLALFPEPCPYREAALARLAHAGVAQRIAMTATHTGALRAAAHAGFAVAPMAASQLEPGLIALPATDCLPQLPEVSFQLFTARHDSTGVLADLADAVATGCALWGRPAQTPVRAPIQG